MTKALDTEQGEGLDAFLEKRPANRQQPSTTGGR